MWSRMVNEIIILYKCTVYSYMYKYVVMKAHLGRFVEPEVQTAQPEHIMELVGQVNSVHIFWFIGQLTEYVTALW